MHVVLQLQRDDVDKVLKGLDALRSNDSVSGVQLGPVNESVG